MGEVSWAAFFKMFQRWTALPGRKGLYLKKRSGISSSRKVRLFPESGKCFLRDLFWTVWEKPRLTLNFRQNSPGLGRFCMLNEKIFPEADGISFRDWLIQAAAYFTHWFLKKFRPACFSTSLRRTAVRSEDMTGNSIWRKAQTHSSFQKYLFFRRPVFLSVKRLREKDVLPFYRHGCV